MNNVKTVSAIITTCNRCTSLIKAIESVYRQTIAPFEVIVVDDCSEDNTRGVINELQQSYSNLIYLRLPERSGACVARNQGRLLAKGEFIAGLDDDDTWMPRRLEVLTGVYDDKYSFVTSQDEYYNNKNSWVTEKPSNIDLELLLHSNCVGNQILVKKSRLDAIDGFDERLPSAQDYDTWVRLVKMFGPARICEEPLQRVCMDQGNIRITSSSNKWKGYWMFYNKHKPLMSRRNRKSQLVGLYLASGKCPSKRTFISLLTIPNWRTWLWHWLMTQPLRVKARKYYKPALRLFSKK